MPWLSRVMRNFVRLSIRERKRRRRREEQAARTEIQPSLDSSHFELEELKEKVAEGVISLDEPYRSTVTRLG